MGISNKEMGGYIFKMKRLIRSSTDNKAMQMEIEVFMVSDILSSKRDDGNYNALLVKIKDIVDTHPSIKSDKPRLGTEGSKYFPFKVRVEDNKILICSPEREMTIRVSPHWENRRPGEVTVDDKKEAAKQGKIIKFNIHYEKVNKKNIDEASVLEHINTFIDACIDQERNDT